MTRFARRWAALAGVFVHGTRRRLGWVYLLWLLGMGLLTAGVSWDDASSTVVLCGSPLPGFGQGRPRESAIELLLCEFFSWAWLASVAVYVLPSVLLPLAGSYSVSATLWLRLTPATPREAAAARLLRILVPAAVFAVLGASWALGCASYHNLPLRGLLAQAAGPPAHLLLAAGVITLLGTHLRTDLGRTLLAFVAVLLPVAAFLLFVTLTFRLHGGWKAWWPYACPFVAAIERPHSHFAAAAVIGGLLLVLSVFCRAGRVIYPPHLSHKETSA